MILQYHKTEYINYNDVINHTLDHEKEVHPSNLSEIVQNMVIKKADKMINQMAKQIEEKNSTVLFFDNGYIT